MSKLQRALTRTQPPGIYEFTTRSLVAALQKEAKDDGWRLYYLDGGKVKDKKTFLEKIARAMNFPAYFGKNWDALNDCLTDMEWARGAGYILLFHAPDKLITTSPADWQMAKEILESAIEFWKSVNVPFYVLLTGSKETDFPQL